MHSMKMTEILNYVKTKPIGAGTEAVNYDAGKYILRVRHGIKFNDKKYQIKKVKNIYGSHNFGQPLYEIKDNSKTVATICKRAFGFATSDLVDENASQTQILRAQNVAIKKMRIIATAPQRAWNQLIRDLNYLTRTDYTIDPSEGNMLYDAERGRFYIIDLRPVKKVRNLGDLILLILTDIPNMPDNTEYFDSELKIVKNLIAAAHRIGFKHQEQLTLKPRALEVLKSQQAIELYKNNHNKIKLI